jgi:riboflavin kinase/FMN adenylyltransferase
MIIIKDIEKLNLPKLTATIGFFDGVHVGHRFLIEELKREATLRNLPSAVITFPEHPRAVLHADYQPKLLNSLDEKLEQLETTGVDYCILLPFTEELSKLSAQQFIQQILCEQLHVSSLLIGYDHRFGHNRADGFEQYVEYAAACGMEVIQAAVYPTTTIHASSSEVRRLILNSNIDAANDLLTYSYSLSGYVTDGRKVGRTIGFPTANIHQINPHKIIPPIGVYAARVKVEEHIYNGMLYIGNRPTLDDGEHITIEVNIFDFNQDIYNKPITVYLNAFIRGDMKLPNLTELKKQLAADREASKVILSTLNQQ